MDSAADRLRRFLGIAAGSAFPGEAATAASRADDLLLAQPRLFGQVPENARVWVLVTDTGHLVWSFKAFDDAFAATIPGDRRWLGQTTWSFPVMLATGTGFLRMRLLQDLRAHHRTACPTLTEPIAGAFIGTGPRECLAITREGHTSRFALWDARAWFTDARIAASEVVAARRIVEAASHVCVTTRGGRALTVRLRDLRNGQPAISLFDGDVVADVKVLTKQDAQAGAAIKLRVGSGKIDFVPKEFAGKRGTPGLPIRPPPDAQTWTTAVWDAEARAGTPPTLGSSLLKRAVIEGVELTSRAVPKLLRRYVLSDAPPGVDRFLVGDLRTNTLLAQVREARDLYESLRPSIREACSDAFLDDALYGWTPSTEAKFLLAVPAQRPALFVAFARICAPSVTADTLRRVFEHVSGEQLDPLILDLVVQVLSRPVPA